MLAAKASRITHMDKRSTITSRVILTAVRLLLPGRGELAKHAAVSVAKLICKLVAWRGK